MVIKLRELLVLFILIFFISCGSKKSVTEKSSQKTSKQQTAEKNISAEEKEKINSQNSLAKVEDQGVNKGNNLAQERSEENGIEQDSNGLNENKHGTASSYTTIQSEDINKTYTLTSNHTQEYINEFASVAITEMNKYKIPASITLAQGVLESGSGRSELALKSNNHFGIKCHKGWKGDSVSHDDDFVGECFRKYKHPKTSYEDHSKFLTSRSRYANLFKLRLTDYVGWAYGLKKAGYATDRKYPNKLISIINKYNLQQYDIVTEKFVYAEDVSPIVAASQTHIVVKGDTLYSISRRYNISVAQLKSMNGLSNNIISIDQELLVP